MHTKLLNIFSLLIIFYSYGISAATATEYKILYLSTQSINIGGKDLKVGDVFKDEEDINWNSDEQYMRAKNVVSKKQRLFSASESKKSGTSSILDFLNSLYDMYIKNNHTSTRSIETVPVGELRDYLDDTFYFDEDIIVPTDLPTDSMSYFRMNLDGNKNEFVKLPSIDGSFLIDEKCLSTLLSHPLDEEITVTIEYINKGEILPITQTMLIVPFKIETEK